MMLNLGSIASLALVAGVAFVLLVGLILAPESPGRARGPRVQFWMVGFLLFGALIIAAAVLGSGAITCRPDYPTDQPECVPIESRGP
jgi:hypothetical protein